MSDFTPFQVVEFVKEIIQGIRNPIKTEVSSVIRTIVDERIRETTKNNFELGVPSTYLDTLTAQVNAIVCNTSLEVTVTTNQAVKDAISLVLTQTIQALVLEAAAEGAALAVKEIVTQDVKNILKAQIRELVQKTTAQVIENIKGAFEC